MPSAIRWQFVPFPHGAENFNAGNELCLFVLDPHHSQFYCPTCIAFALRVSNMPPSHPCNNCNSPTHRRCTGCQLAWYCGMSCQEADWKNHLLDCKPKDQITTADLLYKAIIRSEGPPMQPLDVQTRDDYGFDRAGMFKEFYLLDMYLTVLHPDRMAVKPRVLHKWMTQGTIGQEIISCYERYIGDEERERWYLWLLDNHHQVFNRNVSTPKVAFATAWKAVLEIGWRYSGRTGAPPAESQLHEFCRSLSWSNRKIECLEFCGVILALLGPSPRERFWVPFGMCVGALEDQSHHLYRDLLDNCTFEEFVLAYETSGLLALFQAYGFGPELYPKCFAEVLSASPKNIPSAWYLKQWMVGESSTKQAFYDYGFANCRNIDEYCALEDTYARYFRWDGADPQALHVAFVQNKIYEHVNASMVIPAAQRKVHRRIMKRVQLNPVDPKAILRAWIYEQVWNMIPSGRKYSVELRAVIATFG